jgi:subfamily B ATP-binding cassette protein MsbA
LITYLDFINPFKRYPGKLVATGVSTLFYVVFNTLSLWLIAPVLNVIFLPGKSGEEEKIAQLAGGLRGTYEALKQWSWKLIGGGGDALEMLPRLCVALVIVFLLKNIFAYMQMYFVSYVEQRMIKDLRERVFDHVIRQSYGFFDKRSTGHLMSTVMNDVSTISTTFQRIFTSAVRDPLTVITLGILLVSISWKLTLMAALIVPLFGIIYKKTGGSLKRKSGRIQEGLAEITSNLQETISGARLIKSSVTEETESARFESKSAKLFRNSLRLVRLDRLASPLSEVIGVIILASVLAIGGQQVLKGSMMDGEDFIRFIVILFSILTPARSVGAIHNYLQIGSAAGARIDELLRQPDEPVDEGRIVAKAPKRSIQFENLSFQYSEAGGDVLRDVNLTIRQGEKVALVGRSGSGKTTMANLLARFYTPQKGRILWDDEPINDMTLRSLRKQISMVSQDVFLFNETVRFNICYGMENVREERLRDVMDQAHATEFISKLPKGLDTIVGERGTQLSGGQKQRIAIARALLKDSPLLVFDEATSALDSESERLIQGALEKLFQNRTVIIIAHRLSSIRFADRVIVMDEGKIAVEGTHEQLIETSPLYQTLTKLYVRESDKP